MSTLENGLVVAISQFPLWKCTTNGSIQCFYNFVTSKYSSDRLIWLILSELDVDLDDPKKANVNLVYNNNYRNVYVQNVDHPETKRIVIDFLKSQERTITEIVTLDIVPGMWGLQLKNELPSIQVWTHLCTLHYSKNVKVLVDEAIISDTKSYDTFFVNEIEIAKRASTYVTVSQSECEWIQTIVADVKPMIYYPNRSWWSTTLSQSSQVSRSSVSYIRDKYPHKLLILYVGRISHQKGIHKLLHVDLPANVHFVIMSSTSFGDKGLLESLQKLSNARPDFLTWIGPYFNEDKIKIMQQCDAVICPSVFEPFGLVGLETLLFTDTLLIASGVDGMQDYLIDGGFLKCGTTVESIQQAIGNFARFTPETRRAVVQKGKRNAEKCVDLWERPSVFPNLTLPSASLTQTSAVIPLPPI